MSDENASDGVAPVDDSAQIQPVQGELPLAVVKGEPFSDVPKDLYIPPEALRIFLETFEGPLDLLLYLIKRQNIDILEIDVFTITHQYVQYVEMMDAMNFELAAEYLVMAAMLAEIKSRMLLPRQEADEEDEEDPRAALIRRLQQYERFKQAAMDLDAVPREDRDFFTVKVDPPEIPQEKVYADVSVDELMKAFSDVLKRADMFESHQVEMEKLSTREKMTEVLSQLQGKKFMPFVALFNEGEGRLGVVVTFLAVMELVKESMIDIVQTESFGPIHVKAKAA
ncbi:MAG: ScpA family protein [Cellvibrionales bacterium]|nr:ScpA family protein [Cellvibrionales bacterium]